MKPFVISESHLTPSEVSMREQGQRRLQARKEWPRTDSIHINCKRVRKIVKKFENARFSYVLALEKKRMVVAKNPLPSLYESLWILYF